MSSAALGESPEMSGEAEAERTSVYHRLNWMSQKLKGANKPIIVVLFNGRPLDLHGVIDETNVILEPGFLEPRVGLPSLTLIG